MTPDQSPEPRSSAQRTDIREAGLGALDDVSLDGLEIDERLQSGVPEAQRVSDLDFIQMMGFGRPMLYQEDSMAPSPADPSELDARRPLSFFEDGVTDVDAAGMMPPALDAEDSLAEAIVPSFGPAREEPPPTVILPEPPTALSGYSSEPVRPAPLASAFDFDDLDAGATPSSDATRDPLVAHRELSSPEDDLAELSRAVDHLKVAPKPSPLPARPATEAADDDWTEPKSAAVLRTEPALGVRDLAEAEQLLQELELQPRDVAPPSSDKSAAPTDEHVNNDDEDDAPVHR